jgi:hypothetical protein
MTVDLAELVANREPDVDGKVIPVDTREGSALFAPDGGVTDSMTVVISGGVLNVRAATCQQICTDCCGLSNFRVLPNSVKLLRTETTAL